MIRIVLAGAMILAIGTSSAVAGMMLSRAALARTVTVDAQKLMPLPGALRGPVR